MGRRTTCSTRLVQLLDGMANTLVAAGHGGCPFCAHSLIVVTRHRCAPRDRSAPAPARSRQDAGMATATHGPTHRLDLADPTARGGHAVVPAADPEEGIVLDRPAFYHGGGGQPPDTGV